MNQKDFDTIVEQRITKIHNILKTKAGEYAHHGDRLRNFKDIALFTDDCPEKALLMQVVKHFNAIKDFINDLNEHAPQRLREYPYWDEKIGDVINFMILLEALVIERLDNEKEQKDTQTYQGAGI